MFKQLVFFFCLAMLVFGGYQAWVTLAPAETQIKWTIEGVTEAFNEGNLDECLQAFTVGYKDTSQSTDYEDHVIDKPLLGQGLAYLFRNRVEPETGRFLYRAQLVAYTLAIDLESESKATARFRMTLEVKMGHTWSDVWGVDVKLSFTKLGRQWFISGSSFRTLAGSRPWSWE